MLLADDVVEPLRPQPVGERPGGSRLLRSIGLEKVSH